MDFFKEKTNEFKAVDYLIYSNVDIQVFKFVLAFCKRWHFFDYFFDFYLINLEICFTHLPDKKPLVIGFNIGADYLNCFYDIEFNTKYKYNIYLTSYHSTPEIKERFELIKKELHFMLDKIFYLFPEEEKTFYNFEHTLCRLQYLRDSLPFFHRFISSEKIYHYPRFLVFLTFLLRSTSLKHY